MKTPIHIHTFARLVTLELWKTAGPLFEGVKLLSDEILSNIHLVCSALIE